MEACDIHNEQRGRTPPPTRRKASTITRVPASASINIVATSLRNKSPLSRRIRVLLVGGLESL